MRSMNAWASPFHNETPTRVCEQQVVQYGANSPGMSVRLESCSIERTETFPRDAA